MGLVKGRSLEKRRGYTRTIDRSHLDAAALIKKHEVQLRRKTRDVRTRVAKCIEADDGIFENSL